MIIKVNYSLSAKICSAVLVLCLVLSSIYRTEADEDNVRLPIIMYHHISEDKNALNDYVISPEELESDFRYIKEQGYTSLFPDELFKYTEGSLSLPEKVIMITFDDGFESVYRYAYPLAVKYGLKFTVAVYGKETERFSKSDDHNILYSYMTWDEIKELSESKICEIANHTYSLHSTQGRNGITRNKNEDLDTYLKTVSEDILNLQNYLAKTEIKPDVFVYPYGFYCKDSKALIKSLGFKMSFICTEGVNEITKNPDCLYNLKRYNRPHGINTLTFFNKMQSG